MGSVNKLVPAGEPGLRSFPVRLPRATTNLRGESERAAASVPKDAMNELSRKIATAPPNAVIHLESGYYPTITDVTERSTPVTISGAGDSTRPIILGARLHGASDVRFVDVEFSKAVGINRAPSSPAHAVSRDIELVNSEIDCGTRVTKMQGHVGIGIGIRGGSRDVSLLGVYVHDCGVGLASVAQDPISAGITIRHCLFEDFYGDALDIGGIHDLSITDSVIRNIAHTPGVNYHDDGIQFLGNTANVVIAHNVLANSRDQLLFIQDAIKGRFSHTAANADISVVGNLIYGAGAFAVQDQGGVDVAFVGNTIWASRYGSLLIRRSGYTGTVPNHTLVVDNIVERYGLMEVPGGVVEGYNVFASPLGRHHGPHDVYARSPGLQAPRTGVFGLRPRSPARSSSAPRAVLLSMARRSGADMWMIGLLRTYRARDRGAVGFRAPVRRFGAPFTLTHQKLR